MRGRGLLIIAAAAVAMVVAGATPALAFDTTPHIDVTGDALAAEGIRP